LFALVEYNWHEEKRHFEEMFDIDVYNDNDEEDYNLPEIIKLCRKNAEMKNHINYHLLIINANL
jgi:hypothetical protein